MKRKAYSQTNELIDACQSDADMEQCTLEEPQNENQAAPCRYPSITDNDIQQKSCMRPHWLLCSKKIDDHYHHADRESS